MEKYHIGYLEKSLDEQKKQEGKWKKWTKLFIYSALIFFVIHLASSYAEIEKLSDFTYVLLFISLMGFFISTYHEVEWGKCRLWKCEIDSILKDSDKN